jgi:hypothetical protein
MECVVPAIKSKSRTKRRNKLLSILVKRCTPTNVAIKIAAHFYIIRCELATDQTFVQQKGQRADLRYENEHLHRASLFLLAVPRQRAPDCRKRSRKSDRSRRDTAGPTNDSFGQRSSSSQLQLGPYQQIADEKEAEGKLKRVRIGR